MTNAVRTRKIIERYSDGSFKTMDGKIVKIVRPLPTPPPPPVVCDFKSYKDYKEVYSDYSKRWSVK